MHGPVKFFHSSDGVNEYTITLFYILLFKELKKKKKFTVTTKLSGPENINLVVRIKKYILMNNVHHSLLCSVINFRAIIKPDLINNFSSVCTLYGELLFV